jgi:hypothetical protein
MQSNQRMREWENTLDGGVRMRVGQAGQRSGARHGGASAGYTRGMLGKYWLD